MIKTVTRTIFVLTLVIFLGATTRDAQATQKAGACTNLTNTNALFPGSSPRVSKRMSLYLPVQESFFLKQPQRTTLASGEDKGMGYIAEIGEGEVAEPPSISEEISPTQTIQEPSLSQVSQAEQPIASGSLNAETMYSLVNAARSSAGLAPFSKDERICSVAASRGPELYNEIMVTHSMHTGFYARNLPYFATENVISMRTEGEAMNWWMNSSVHRSAILGDYTHACGTCVGNACNMIFTNFEPKQVPPTTI